MLFATLMLTIAAADRVSLAFGLQGLRLFRKLLAAVPAIALIGYDSIVLRVVPVLSVSLLAIVWMVIWFVVSDVVFLNAPGEPLIRALTRVFVW